ncbi:HD domain-containing phosphohydrolase [Vulgatibacter incomptus]|uniref:HD domain-containing phosphohydrolase n=1 Tax=Vulgatibacter incomptus TaxID=1391653 RepID=UPI0006821B53
MGRVLVVDDDVLILRALQRVLDAQGFHVTGKNTPEEALGELRERPATLIISDYMMPGMNGVEFLTEARRICPDAPRLLLTAANDFRVAAHAVNSGEVYRLLSKPWNHQDLITTVRQAYEVGELKRQHARLTAMVHEQNAELQRMNGNLRSLVEERTRDLLEGMINALDYRDMETQWHSRRVSLYARRLAEALGLPQEELDEVEMGALLHDVGKIGVRDSVLLKPGPLTPTEWEEMKEHPAIGFRLLRSIEYLSGASTIVLQHQERWDGKGYPAGLAGEAISIGARIFSVVDTLDAIRSDRPYRSGQPFDVALREIRRCAGTQFDPMVVEAFASVPETEWEAIRARVEKMAAKSAAADASDGLGEVGRFWQRRQKGDSFD